MKLHHSINYSFLIAGHTKFGPDRCFGLIKKASKVTYISSLYEFARLVDPSSTTGTNKAQLVGTHDGRVFVTVFDWVTFLGQYFRRFPNVKKLHHFRLTKDNPVGRYYREFFDKPRTIVYVVKEQCDSPFI